MSNDLKDIIIESNILKTNNVGEIIVFLDLIKDKLTKYFNSINRKEPIGDYHIDVFENYDDIFYRMDELIGKTKISNFQEKIDIIDSLTKLISFFKSVCDMPEDDYKKYLEILWLELNILFFHASKEIENLKKYLQHSL